MIDVKEINSSDLKSWIDQDRKFTLLDIRSESEVRQGKIPDCQFIPMQKVPDNISSFSTNDCIVVYCRSGIRSAQVCGYMQQQGFKDVFNLKGGIIDWYQNGNPVVTE